MSVQSIPKHQQLQNLKQLKEYITDNDVKNASLLQTRVTAWLYDCVASNAGLKYTGLQRDYDSEKYLPMDLKPGLIALKTTGNGNCMFNAVSIAIKGVIEI
jgi:hypothetical protein